MNTARVVFDSERASQVFRAINDLWQQNKGIFHNITLPQNLWPLPESKEEKARWLLFCSIFMRGSIISETPFKYLDWLRRNNPEIFNPLEVQKRFSVEDIRQLLRQAAISVERHFEANGSGGLAYKEEEFSRLWHANASVVATRWNGRVLDIFDSVSDFEEVFSRIDQRRHNGHGLHGMRRKIFSLLTIWFQEFELIPVFPTPLPVDFHVLRTLWATDCVSFIKTKPFVDRPVREDFDARKQQKHHGNLLSWQGDDSIRISEPLLNEIAIWSQQFLAELKISHLDLNPAIWVLSRDLCSGQLQNRTIRSNKRGLPDELESNASLWPRKYHDPCSFCPLADFCKHSIPSAPYYRTGCLVRQKRVDYPGQQFLPGITEYAGPRRTSK